MNSVTNGTLSATNAVANETAIPFATAWKSKGKSPLHIGVANGMVNLFATAGKPALIKPNGNSALSLKCAFLNFWFSTR